MQSTKPTEKPTEKPMLWPGDAVMIVCARSGTENRAKMESVHQGECRDCGCDVAYDGKSYRSAVNLPARHGRPIKFFCVDCCTKYDVNSIDKLVDHRS